MRFTALKDFASKETNSQYVKGLGYTVREGNATLAALVGTPDAPGPWVKERMVSFGGPAVKITGKG